MKSTIKHLHKSYNYLRECMPIILLGVLVFFGSAIIQLQQTNKQLLDGVNYQVENTNKIVDKQEETLTAIRDLSLDNKLTSKRLGDTIICMLLVPWDQRTTDTQKQCREEAMKNAPDGVDVPNPSTSDIPIDKPAPVQPTPIQPEPPQPTPPVTQAPPVTQPQSGPVQRLIDGVLTPVVNLLDGLL